MIAIQVIQLLSLLGASHRLFDLYITKVEACKPLKVITNAFGGLTQEDLLERWTVCNRDGVQYNIKEDGSRGHKQRICEESLWVKLTRPSFLLSLFKFQSCQPSGFYIFYMFIYLYLLSTYGLKGPAIVIGLSYFEWGSNGITLTVSAAQIAIYLIYLSFCFYVRPSVGFQLLNFLNAGLNKMHRARDRNGRFRAVTNG